MTDTKTWMCLICGWIYDEAAGCPEDGIAPGTAWADVPMNWLVLSAVPAKKTLKWWPFKLLKFGHIRPNSA